MKPYGIAGSRTVLTADPQITNDGYADIGLDVKYGITQNLTADFTYNSDFAQVEVDEQQVNLTRFSLRRGDYYGGTLTSAGLRGGRVELTPQLSLEPSISFNWIDLPQGRFDQHVAVTRPTYTLTPRAYVSGLVQYNSGSRAVSGNFRFRWEWAPGSKLFLVYTEDRNTDVLDRWSELSNRGFVIKINRLLRI